MNNYTKARIREHSENIEYCRGRIEKLKSENLKCGISMDDMETNEYVINSLLDRIERHKKKLEYYKKK